MAGYYVRRGEKIVGPVTTEKLKELAASGKIVATDELAQKPEGPWTPCAKVKGLLPTSRSVSVAQIKPTSKPLRPVVERPGALIARVAPQQPMPLNEPEPTKPPSVVVRALSAVRTSIGESARRKHELKLAKIQAEANRPQTATAPVGSSPQSIVFAPTITQTVVVGGQGPRVAYQSRLVAILLALFLGGLSVHRMYLGQSFILRLLIAFTVVGLFLTSLLALFDAIGLIFMSRSTFDRRFGV